MSQKHMFKNLIFYADACFSGSVFYKDELPSNMYVATAAPVGEYAYSCNYDPNLHNFPCDQFSYNFLADLERNNHPGYTWNDDFNYIQGQCHYSQTCRYGDVDTIGPMSINDLIGSDAKKAVPGVADETPLGEKGGVAQVDVPLALAQHMYEEFPTEENRKKLQFELSIRKAVDSMANRIMEAAMPGMNPVTLPACTTCDESCPCYSYCLKDKSADYCQFECCNEENACHQHPPGPPPMEGIQSAVTESCLETLSVEYLTACGNDHAYLRKPDALLYRLCKRDSVNVAAAVAEIHKQCKLFKKSF